MELSAGLIFSCCSTEETSWQELKFQQVNPARKRLLRMFWLPAPGSPGAQKPAAGSAQSFHEEKLCSSVLPCLLTYQPGQPPRHWECGGFTVAMQVDNSVETTAKVSTFLSLFSWKQDRTTSNNNKTLFLAI